MQIKIFNIISWNLIFIINISSNYKLNLIFWIRSLAFFVKIPIYFLHFWLPKAHVESPTYGSIILAAIFYIFPFFKKPKFSTIKFRFFRLILFWQFLTIVIILTWVGARPVETPYIELRFGITIYYFFSLKKMNKFQ